MKVSELVKVLAAHDGETLVKIAGYDVTSTDTVPAEGCEAGYLDIVGK